MSEAKSGKEFLKGWTTSENFINWKELVFRIGFFLIPVLYFFLYAPFGLNDTDDGVVLGLAWRVFNGDIPYRDFVWVRPPLTPMLHAVTLLLIPENFQYIFERFLFYTFIASYSLFGVLILDQFFELGKRIANVYLLASISFVVSAHNFPPMPWYTTDGLFFSTLGFFLISRKKIFLGSLACFLGTMAKQSFYPVLLLALIFVFFLFGKRFLVRSISYFIIFYGCFFMFLFQQEILDRFLSTTTGVTSLQDLLMVGFWRYFWFDPITLTFFVTLALIGLLLIFWEHGKAVRKKLLVVGYLFSGVVLISNIYFALKHESFLYPFTSMNYLQILSLLSIFFIFYLFYRKESAALSLLVMFSLSWCTSISWGYQTPALFSTPLVVGALIMLQRFSGAARRSLTRLSIFILVSFFAMFLVLQQFPYRESPRRDLDFHAGDVFPKLSFIWTDRATYDQLLEFKGLVEKYPSRFHVLPALPAAAFLTGTRSPVPAADWTSDLEIGLQVPLFARILSFSSTHVFLMDRNKSSDAYLFPYCSLADFVQDNWTLIEKGIFFSVYKSPYRSKIAE